MVPVAICQGLGFRKVRERRTWAFGEHTQTLSAPSMTIDVMKAWDA